LFGTHIRRIIEVATAGGALSTISTGPGDKQPRHSDSLDNPLVGHLSREWPLWGSSVSTATAPDRAAGIAAGAAHRVAPAPCTLPSCGPLAAPFKRRRVGVPPRISER
jgi:hypothetical protein